MKYIKLFEDLFEDNLQDFCDNYLAYLKDEGFNVYINSAVSMYGWKNGEITISYPSGSYNPFRNINFMLDDFSWDVVKDHFIPFLQMLYKEYNYDKSTDKIIFFTPNAKYITKSFDEVVNDKIFPVTNMPINKDIKKIIIKKPTHHH
jgi:hypothetical protein